MKNILDDVTIVQPGAPRLTIFGKRGIGKSTLASQFPSPLFLLTEDNELPGIKSLPLFNDYVSLSSALTQLLKLDVIPYKTIVLDSISKLDDLVLKYTMAQSPPIGKGVNQRDAQTLAEAWGGYGAGYEKAAELHKALKRKFDRFKERGICVIYIAHLAVTKHKAPDQEDFDIYNIIINHDKSRAVYTDDVDAVLFCKQRSFTTETESGRTLVKSASDRIISTALTDGNISKTRYIMPEEIPLSFDELSKHIPFFQVPHE